MKITEAIIFLEDAKKRSNKKSEKKHYDIFIAVLTDLNSKELDQDQFLSIEKQLDTLELTKKVSFKQLHSNFSKLKQFLKLKFSLTVEGYYTSLGIAIGMCMGIAFGGLIERYLGASIGMTLGMLVGIAIGKSKDAKAEVEGKSLNTSLL